jgi:hypothetical protein
MSNTRRQPVTGAWAVTGNSVSTRHPLIGGLFSASVSREQIHISALTLLYLALLCASLIAVPMT